MKKIEYLFGLLLLLVTTSSLYAANELNIQDLTIKDPSGTVLRDDGNGIVVCPNKNYSFSLRVATYTTQSFSQKMYLLVRVNNGVFGQKDIEAGEEFNYEDFSFNITPTNSGQLTITADISDNPLTLGYITSDNDPSVYFIATGCQTNTANRNYCPPGAVDPGKPGTNSNTITTSTYVYYGAVPGERITLCPFIGSRQVRTSYCASFQWQYYMGFGGSLQNFSSPGYYLCNENDNPDRLYDIYNPSFIFPDGKEDADGYTHVRVYRNWLQIPKKWYDWYNSNGVYDNPPESNQYSNPVDIKIVNIKYMNSYYLVPGSTYVTCGETTTLNYPYIPDATYTWTPGPGCTVTAPDPNKPFETVVSFSIAGNRYVNLTITANDGRFAPIAMTQWFFVPNQMNYPVLQNITANAGEPLTITLPEVQDATYTWDIPGAVFDGTPTNICRINNFTSAYVNKSYTVTITPTTSTGCRQPVSNSAAITVNDKVLQFNGSSQYVQIPNYPALNIGTGDFTMEAWINASSTQPAFPQIMSYRSGSNNGFLFGLFVNGQPFIQMGGSTGNWRCETCPDLRDNNCHHVAISRHRDTMSFYLDGKWMQSYPVGYLTRNIQSPGNLYIGRDYASPSSTYFNGLIHDVRIWNATRSAEDIKTNYNRALTGTEPSLIGFWKLNEGQGQVAYDYSIYHMNGTLGSTTDVESFDPVWADFNCTNLNRIAFTDTEDIEEQAALPVTTDQEINLYPNPTQNGFSVSLKNGDASTLVDISIYNVTGALIIEKNQVPQNEIIDLKSYNLAAGIYLVKIHTPSGTFSKILNKE
ncbi:MAG: LamG-like jellyroll fold domain-containing protein [Cytophaga sp.]|uniref:LamG-like jellyroll fold domain-containing protein n=1 Tax=Cytophaga sp. TaxID=29535 RepID=UPI003F7F6C78